MTDTMAVDGWAGRPAERDEFDRANDSRANALLAVLPEEVLLALQRSSSVMEFQAGDHLRVPHKPLPAVYFVRSGLVAICGGDGTPHVEVASVGNEGVIGLTNLFGVSTAEHAAVALAPCVVDAVEAPVFGMLLGEYPVLNRVLMGYANARMQQLVRLSVCNARHRLEQRLARWIMTAQARLGPERIVVTHRDLSLLLGVRRASVTESMHLLEGHGAIRSHRGYVSVRDLEKLADLSCGCHHLREPAAA